MIQRSRFVTYALFFASALLFAFSLLNMSARSSSAQLDPTAQQETANAMVAQMFAGTQTAQAGSATPTPTPSSTPTASPIPSATPQMVVMMVQIPYIVGIDLTGLQEAIQNAAETYAASVTPEQRPSASETVTPNQIPELELYPTHQWQYLIISRCARSGNSSLYFTVDSNAPLSNSLRFEVGRADPWTDSPIQMISVAGQEGWELLPVANLFEYYPEGDNGANGRSIGDVTCFVAFTFRRETSFPILPVD